jgi:regulatory protein
MELNPILLEQYPDALNRAVAMLAARPCSRQEIEQRLTRRKFDPEVISMVLYKLEREGLLNDREFSDLWVQSRSKKYGPARLRQELRMKGVEEETARSALGQFSEEDQLARATGQAEKKLRTIKPGTEPRKVFQQVTSFLVRRGFSWNIAKQAFQAASDSMDDFEE